MTFLKILDYLSPAAETPEELRWWRVKVAGLLTLCSVTLLLSPVGLNLFFVTEAEAEEAHQLITEELQGLKSSVDKLVVSDTERAERERLREIREIRSSILELRHQACQASGPLRVQLNSQVGDLQSQYMALVGEEFPSIPCGDLLGQ